MPAYIILGGQYGDEGKGKIIDFCTNNIVALDRKGRSKEARPADIVVRFSGGNNAGHTVRNPLGEFKLHLIPAGIFNSQTLNIIGPRVAVDFWSLFNEDPEHPGEMQALMNEGGIRLEHILRRMRISKKAHLVFPWHILEDRLQEEARGRAAIGTTKRGMGPMLTDKTARFGLRVGDLEDVREFRKKFDIVWDSKRDLFKRLYQRPHSWLSKYFSDEAKACMLKDLLHFREVFGPTFAHIEPILQNAHERGKQILFEGAQGYLLDIDHGSYPNVTSSNCGAEAAYSCGITKFDEVIGVVKAYTTRVGSGPLPTEMPKKIGDPFRKATGEFGVTTGRARRIGWLEIPALQYFVRMNGVTGLALTRLDSLDYFPRIKMGTGYTDRKVDFNHVLDGKKVTAKFQEVPGWGPGQSASGQTAFASLPAKAKAFCRLIEKQVAPIKLISTGPDREQTIVVKR